MRRRRPSLRLPAALAALAVVLLVFGVWVGGRHSGWLPGPLRAALVGDEDTAVVDEAIRRVHDTYYREIPEGKLADDAIEGVVGKLGDRFSNYFTPAEYRQFKQSQNSEFSGIGLAVSQDPRGLLVEVVYDGSPAKRAGMRAGDILVEAGGRSLKGRSQDESVSFIKGPPGTQVKVTWMRDGKRMTKTITRSTVSVPAVASKMAKAGPCTAGVVHLAQFSSGAHAELYAALRRQQKRGAKVFVLDLRDNGGGLVSEAQLVASAFLADGPIVTTRGRAVEARTLRATGDPVVPKQPVVVLVNRGTASASEIVTGALQDRKRAEVVGTRTFGKGVFQEVIELSNGGALDITAGQYFTPNGRNLGGRGVTPGTGIQPDVKAMDDPKTKRDEALDRALAVLAGSCRG
ncbi:MAG: carboxyl-terminal processing protease [Solirubrobacteraceae bacterium]|nr:carboxyl-terminal processing protease [Solirubrobacteraceae bacterium]